MSSIPPPPSYLPKSKATRPGPAALAASAPPVSKAAICGYVMGGLMIMMGLLNLTEGKDPELGAFSDAAQGMKQTVGFAYLAAGVNTCMIATLCQHTKKKDNC